MIPHVSSACAEGSLNFPMSTTPSPASDSGPEGFEHEIGHQHGPPPPPARDPALEIPEILRTPVRKPEMPGTQLPGGASVSGAGVGFAMAFDFIGSIGAGTLLGWLADRWFGSLPIGTLVGLALGFAGAMIRIMRQAARAERRDAAERDARRSPNRLKR